MLRLLCILVCFSTLALPSIAAADPTLDNLQSAHARTTRDIETFARCAKKADDEGFSQVAGLFRAAVKSRQTHLSLLDRAIRDAGATPKSDSLPVPEIKTTRDNLVAIRDAAIAERDKQLAPAMTQAAADKNADARKAFLAARESLYELIQYSKDALADLDSWKKGKKDFYVCKTCGYLLDRLDVKKCPVDNAAKEQFEKVN